MTNAAIRDASPGSSVANHAVGTLVALAASLLAASVAAIGPDVLVSVRAVAPELAGRIREARGFQQSAFGQLFVFDRRGHTVYGIDEQQTSMWEIVQIGAEPGRILDPTAFAVAPDGSFVVADAPGNRGRIQIFGPAGNRLGGFLLASSTRPRLTFENVVMNGIGSLQYTGTSILLSQPENGALITEYDLTGRTSRTFGELRATGHEQDADVHLALNSGIPLVTPGGDILFVFQAGVPAFRRYDRAGRLLFERTIQGRDIDRIVEEMPRRWPRSAASGELPLVRPTIRAAAVDGDGRLWVSFVAPFTYVFDVDGDKIRMVQFRGAGLVTPNSLFFGPRGTLLTTPGLYEFKPQ
jgi:hypothetical protein